MGSAEEVSCRREYAGDGVWEDESAVGVDCTGGKPIPRLGQLLKEPLIAARPLDRQERRRKENRVCLAVDTCNENEGHAKATGGKGAIEGEAVMVEQVVSTVVRSDRERCQAAVGSRSRRPWGARAPWRCQARGACSEGSVNGTSSTASQAETMG